ncbi:pentatricopeptide repeat domain-containing protein [Colletotrichum navitas]|uniref:Pentatricopeptide repeat domain-containing protein n=1 Tax=Colletotrichum navitas TaxID=681940 RepID=A0AAD8Q2G3_9PEZI|nr:pentatricopeptide repeat domain-containing protein [Colletotrichum navitas]KAK1594238.1 pentatricopeptide repeat domain-containing protein [Colletotrichum navitas]
MSGSRVIFDGLWRCLCPSTDAYVAARLLTSPILPRASIATSQRRQPVRSSHTHVIRPQCRRYSTATSSKLHSESDARAFKSDEAVERNATAGEIRHGATPTDSEPGDPNEQLRAAPLSAIYEALQVLQGQPKTFQKVATFITHLVQSRNAELDSQLYEHLVVAMADVQGSAAMLAQLFAEMKQLQLKPTTSMCHAALAALAVHPDYLVRNEILTAMKQSWTEISIEGQSHNALGLLRDGQFEMALDALEAMIDKHVPIPSWVYDIFIFVFAQHGFVDEAIKLAHSKVHAGSETSLTVWYMLLDTCAQAHHYEGTRYIWGRLLETEREHLSDGTLLNVINTATRQYDYELVTSASSLITQRGSKLLAHHYEALIDCYGGAGDVASALRVLCIMFKAISVAPYASTRSIYCWIKNHPESIDTALKTLTELVRSYRVPIAALNVLIEAAVDTHGYAKALEIYQNAHKYTEATPNHVTIRYVLQACDDMESLKSLVAENPELALKADRNAFGKAIYEYAVSGDLDLAYKCIELYGKAPEGATGEPPGKTEAWIPKRTLLAIIRKSLDAQDERVWWLIEQAERRNIDVQSGIAKLMASFADEIKRSTGLAQEDRALGDDLEPRQHPTL